jgi:hypothetical protein
MERVAYLGKLAEKIPRNEIKKSDTPPILATIRKCQKYGLSYELMCELNFTDLLAILVEFDIDNLKEYFKIMNRQNPDVVEASNADILKMHGKRKKVN